MAGVGGLTVRRFERHEVGLKAVLSLTGESARVVRFSSGSGVDSSSIEAMLTDIGDGGLGLRTSLMLPRGVTVRVRVPHPTEAGTWLLDAEARLQRVAMKGREPSYLLGMAFVNQAPNLSQQIAGLRAFPAARAATAESGGAC